MPQSDQGVFEDRYQLIPRVLIFATRGESVLLIKGAPTKRLWANLYNGIGGHLEKGEDVLSAARREFLEETGLQLINPWLSAVVTIDTGEPIGIGMFLFRGETDHHEPRPSQEGSLEWIPFQKIHKYPLVEDLPMILPAVLALEEGNSPLFAQYCYDEQQNLIIELGN
ncbi:NUDIX domain-containing protein [Chloroflexota bacterium]